MMEAQVAQLPAVALEAEEQVLGALMVTAALDAVIAETKLAPEHFYRDRHATIFRAILALSERGEAIDSATVVGELRARAKLKEVGGAESVSHLASTVAAPGHVLSHARRVIEEASWRLRRRAGQLAVEAADSRDQAKLAEAEDLLRLDLVHVDSDLDADAQAEVAWSLLEGRAAAEFPYPWPKLNRLTSGGMRRGQLVVVSGYSNFGKSLFVDAMLDEIHKHGKRPWLYMNEMTVEERVARKITRSTGVPYARLVGDGLRGPTHERDRQKVLDQLNEGLGWGMTEVSGWSAQEVCHHIRRSRPDVAAVDLLNRFDWSDEREVSRIVTAFNDTAKLANCTLILVCQLNERVAGASRAVRSAVFKPPVYTDLKGTGDIKNHADHVLFIHRDQDPENGEPLESGSVYFGKVRGGSRGGLPVTFQERFLRFLPTQGGGS